MAGTTRQAGGGLGTLEMTLRGSAIQHHAHLNYYERARHWSYAGYTPLWNTEVSLFLPLLLTRCLFQDPLMRVQYR